MRTTIHNLILTSIVFVISIISTNAVAQNLFNQPESVEYDFKKERYLVSNYGDGNIVQVDKNGTQSYFDTTLTKICALHIAGDTMYVASNDDPYSGIAGYDLTTDKMILFIPILNPGLINDITSDASGNLYVTDYYDSKIFKVNIAEQSYSILTSTGLNMPNGIVYDFKNNRLISHSNNESKYPIKTVNPISGEVELLVNTNIGSLDGLVFDSEGNFYFSTWVNNSIYSYEKTFSNPPRKLFTGYNGPADIFYNKYKNEIAVPNFYTNKVDFVSLQPSYINENTKRDNDILTGFNAFPNPFNSETNISYSIGEASLIKVEIYDSLGRLIKNLENEFKPAGSYTLKWNAGSLASGKYFCCISGTDFSLSKGILLIK